MLLTELPLGSSDVYKAWVDEVARRTEAGYTTVAKASRTGDPDDFLTEETVIALLLAAAMVSVSDDITTIVFSGGDDAGRVLASLERANQVAQTAYTDAVDSRVRGQVGLLVDKGADKTEARALISGRAHKELVDGMSRSAKYYTNNYFNRIVMPELVTLVERVMEGQTGYSLASVRELLDARLKSVPYWRMIANMAASRSYHYGLLKGASLSGYQQYEFVAVLDDRTSVICSGMSGRVFSVATGVRWVEELAALKDPEAIAERRPFLSATESVDALRLSDAELSALGLAVPPLHPNCRSTLRLL